MPIHTTRDGDVAIITLDDPERRNALSVALVEELLATLDALHADESAGALVITGTEPAFCSGADVAALRALTGVDADEQLAAGLRAIYAGFLAVYDSPLPTVAAVNGPAVGAGMNLALACDVRIVNARARFDPRFLKIGIHPGGGHTRLLDRLVGPERAAAMVLFGETVSGAAAVERGLAWECVEDDRLLARAAELATRAAAVPAELRSETKAALRAAARHADQAAAVVSELGPQVRSMRALRS